MTAPQQIDRTRVKAALQLGRAMRAMEQALVARLQGDCWVPPRLKLKRCGGDQELLFMHAASESLGLSVTKCLRLTSPAVSRGRAFVQGELLVHDYADGRLLAQMDAEAITAIRTAACAAVAVSRLAATDASRLVVFGSGPLAKALTEAIVEIRPISAIRIVSRNPSRGRRCAAELQSDLDVPTLWTRDPDVVAEADIICTATRATRPVFDVRRLKQDVHVCAVGAYRPDMSEIPAALLEDCDLFVDSLDDCARDAGDLLGALKDEEGVRAVAVELGDLVRGRARQTRRRTVYKSVGEASQDLFAAAAVLDALAAVQRPLLLAEKR